MDKLDVKEIIRNAKKQLKLENEQSCLDFSSGILHGILENHESTFKLLSIINADAIWEMMKLYFQEFPNDKGFHGVVWEKLVRLDIASWCEKPYIYDSIKNDFIPVTSISQLNSTSHTPMDACIYDAEKDILYVSSAKYKDLMKDDNKTIALTKTELSRAKNTALKILRENPEKYKNTKIKLVAALSKPITSSSIKDMYNEDVKSGDVDDIILLYSSSDILDYLDKKDWKVLEETKTIVKIFENDFHNLQTIFSYFDGNLQKWIDNLNKDIPLWIPRKSQRELIDKMLKSTSLDMLISAECRFGKTFALLRFIDEKFGDDYAGKNVIIQTHFPAIAEEFWDNIYHAIPAEKVNIIDKNGQNGVYDKNKINFWIFSSQYTINKNGIKPNVKYVYSKADIFAYDEAHVGIDTVLQNKIRKLLPRECIKISITGTPFTYLQYVVLTGSVEFLSASTICHPPILSS